MTIRIALNHKTHYRYDRPITIGPQSVRLRPAPHCRTPIRSYSLTVEPSQHFTNWQQDPYGNFLARLVFSELVTEFSVEVDLTADMTVINPFDFFLEPEAEEYPFTYSKHLAKDLKPFFEAETPGPHLAKLLSKVDRSPRRTIDFLVMLNQQLANDIGYVIRLEPGVQTCEETLGNGTGSCRDSAWLLVQILRNMGIAARFASGYLLQLTADQKSLDGPSGPECDFTDLHAWCEAFLPGAGWIGLDPTSGLLAGEGHIPLACTPEPHSAAPISGALDKCEVEFSHIMQITRVHEDPRVTKPYTEEQWTRIESLGHEVDKHLEKGDVRLTMGGEPTFVSIDDMDGDEWMTVALGENKRKLSEELLQRLKKRFANGALLHYGQGKWYPGESLPRWALTCYWRRDREPIWRNPALQAVHGKNYGHTVETAQAFTAELAERLGVARDCAMDVHEDAWYYLWRERRLPVNVDVRHSKLEDIEERTRLAKVFDQGVNAAVGCVLPLKRLKYHSSVVQDESTPRWQSGAWPVRPEQMFLIPGDSPIGYRLPLSSLPWVDPKKLAAEALQPIDPFVVREALPEYEELQARRRAMGQREYVVNETSRQPAMTTAGGGWNPQQLHPENASGSSQGGNGHSDQGGNGNGKSSDSNGKADRSAPPVAASPQAENLAPSEVIRTALCVEPRDGVLHIFMPPVEALEDYLELITAVEDTADALQAPVVIEGYLPPHDPRVNLLKVTPDPGVIEVNVQPASDWNELKEITTGVYEDARESRLGTEKFDLDGSHTGTGGGNHVVLGGATPADSPFLRRPQLLASLIAFWHNHPSLSYLFSGKFIGPTSQAPRVDEGRRDARYELQIALDLVKDGREHPPWMVDRLFRNLLVDLTGNTHRAEFCIDKLFSPDSSTGRLGLVEFRGFEMPPHARMSLTQQLLLRAMTARFWEKPYEHPLIDWDTSLHDRFLLPHFVWSDFQEVIAEMRAAGFPLEDEWFAPHFEFRFPRIGHVAYQNVAIELRTAIEPWYVLGEEAGGGGMARYVDSSVERLQVKVQGFTSPRYAMTCNGRTLPLHSTGVEGEYVAGLRYRAWQPPSCLHPNIPVDEPLLFDLIDTWNERSVGGCQYHVGHPGGLNPSTFPVNPLEAESRRGARFTRLGHTPGPLTAPPVEPNRDFPMTLDLRRNKQLS
ncbi:transglutaminase family protein [Lignipirellula cremea]|uniref:Transglutaminase-like domain-containing protein n=1 Tax=Lignipirellula cremea TaxID=2528010 RepID=A0A518DMV5_9BACT|nr:transglutaminase family protein [Lignipirellula cremea]QDU93153.1 hypothetical protein Pla8534_09320 [Lignipirellula cremea]